MKLILNRKIKTWTTPKPKNKKLNHTKPDKLKYESHQIQKKYNLDHTKTEKLKPRDRKVRKDSFFEKDLSSWTAIGQVLDYWTANMRASLTVV